jgi:hypothetical protein
VAGLAVVKAQVSCGLQVDDIGDPRAVAALEGLVENRFLHQTTSGSGAGLRRVDDLPEALAGGLPRTGSWRVHYHVPLHLPPPSPLRSSVPVLLAVLAALLAGDAAVTDHLEVETYTWPVLAQHAGRVPLVEGIVGELDWTRRALAAFGLQEAP